MEHSRTPWLKGKAVEPKRLEIEIPTGPTLLLMPCEDSLPCTLVVRAEAFTSLVVINAYKFVQYDFIHLLTIVFNLVVQYICYLVMNIYF